MTGKNKVGRIVQSPYLFFLRLYIFIIIILPIDVFAQYYGTVADSISGEPLPYANIYIQGTEIGTESNENGYYYLQKIPAGEQVIECRYIGYEKFSKKILAKPKNPILLDINLKPIPIQLKSVTAERHLRATMAPVSVISLDNSDIQFAPKIGECDLTRMLTLLPGITFNSELSSKMYIRGSESGHTLILIDGVPVFSPTHLFGIYSSFNTDVIKNVQVIKGGFPAKYGGRCGSVVDITHKEGNKNKFSTHGAFGLVSSNLNFEGPISNGSFFLGARRTYFDLPKRIMSLSKKIDTRQYPDYYFYDLTLKLVYNLGTRDKLKFSSFYSRDFLNYVNYEGRLEDEDDEMSREEYELLERIKSNWRNGFATISWEHIISPEMLTNLQLYTTQYNSLVIPSANALSSQDNTVNKDIYFKDVLTESGVKNTWQFAGFNHHRLDFGLWYSFYNLNYTGEILYSRNQMQIKGLFPHTGCYLSDTWSPTAVWKFDAGLRANYYPNGGYFNLEPRAAVRYYLTDKLILKAAGGIFSQFVVNISPPTFINLSTADFWFPIDSSLSPARSKQIIGGFEYDLGKGFFLDIEAYYTFTANVTELKPQNKLYQTVGEMMYAGKGRAYGLDFWLERKIGKISGWLSYSYSHSLQSYPEIDNGKWFPVRWNRIHELVSVISLDITAKWHLNANWRMASGQPFSAIEGTAYYFQPLISDYSGEWGGFDDQYSDRNKYRVPGYHRLDLGLRRDFSFKRWKMTLDITIFNAYCHFNKVAAGGFEYDGSYYYQTMLPTIPSISLEFER